MLINLWYNSKREVDTNKMLIRCRRIWFCQQKKKGEYDIFKYEHKAHTT